MQVIHDQDMRKMLCGAYAMADNDEPAHVAGWKNQRATVTLHTGGFWHAPWSVIEAAHANGRKIPRSALTFDNGAWLGFGEWPPNRPTETTLLPCRSPRAIIRQPGVLGTLATSGLRQGSYPSPQS